MNLSATILQFPECSERIWHEESSREERRLYLVLQSLGRPSPEVLELFTPRFASCLAHQLVVELASQPGFKSQYLLFGPKGFRGAYVCLFCRLKLLLLAADCLHRLLYFCCDCSLRPACLSFVVAMPRSCLVQNRKPLLKRHLWRIVHDARASGALIVCSHIGRTADMLQDVGMVAQAGMIYEGWAVESLPVADGILPPTLNVVQHSL